MAKTAPQVWKNGTLALLDEARISIVSHAAARGSLAFDVGSFHPTANGVALFRAREHATRFLQSARIIGLEVRYDEDALVRAAAEVVVASKASEGLVRWAALFDASEPDLLPRSSATSVVVAVQIMEDPPRTSAMTIAIFDDARKAAPEALSPSAKIAAAYAGPTIARRRAIAAGAEEVVLLDVEGNLAEGPTCNVFAVVNGELWTPPLRYVLPGITRDAVISLAKEEGIVVREAPLTVEAFAAADEAFLTATSLPIAPIGAIVGMVKRASFGNPERPITRKLTERLHAAQHGASRPARSWTVDAASLLGAGFRGRDLP